MSKQEGEIQPRNSDPNQRVINDNAQAFRAGSGSAGGDQIDTDYAGTQHEDLQNRINS